MKSLEDIGKKAEKKIKNNSAEIDFGEKYLKIEKNSSELQDLDTFEVFDMRGDKIFRNVYTAFRSNAEKSIEGNYSNSIKDPEVINIFEKKLSEKGKPKVPGYDNIVRLNHKTKNVEAVESAVNYFIDVFNYQAAEDK